LLVDGHKDGSIAIGSDLGERWSGEDEDDRTHGGPRDAREYERAET